MEEEFSEEISLAPSQQLEKQIQKVINDGINGEQCEVNLATQQEQKVVVDCISSGNTLIWYIYTQPVSNFFYYFFSFPLQL